MNITMSPEEAVKLILAEAHAGGAGVLVAVRNGEDPGAERMRNLILALKTMFHFLEGQLELDRRLAAALFVLGSEVPLTISSLASRGQRWRQGFMEDEVYEMLLGVQSIFDDRRQEIDQPEIIH